MIPPVIDQCPDALPVILQGVSVLRTPRCGGGRLFGIITENNGGNST